MPPKTRLTADEAKEVILGELEKGSTVDAAARTAGKSTKTYEYYRKTDDDFRQKIDLMRAIRSRDEEGRQAEAGDFEHFRRKYLKTESFTHQLQWIDILEGRDPRDVHPAMIYEPAKKNRLLINTPPFHAKTSTITLDYVTYRICKDPNVRIILISKTLEKAKEFIYGVKSRLTHPDFIDLQMAFAPQGGFKESADMWTSNKVYLAPEGRAGGHKDPTLQAIGMGGQIYGARADLIILDDCVTLSNAHEWEKQMRWVQQEVASRLGPPGKLLVVGTRVASVDLYSELRNPDHFSTGKSPWTYFAQPAVLEQPDEVSKWVTLWPKSDRPFEGAEDEDQPDDDGHWPYWTGERMSDIRDSSTPSMWQLVYMQADVAEDQVFHPVCVRGSVNGMRKVGLLNGDLRNHPEEGMANKYVICSLDPAVGGDAGWIALAADRATRKRYVLDAIRMSNPTPARIREQIQAWTEKYSPAEWRIEKNGLNRYITQDNLIRDFLATRGVVLREHFTGADKWDADYGVAGMAPLFGSMERRTDGLRHNKDSLIELPSSDNEGVKSLIEQLVTWSPGNNKHVKADMVLALWFAEIRAREICNQSGVYGKSHLQSPLMSRGQRARQVVVNLDSWQQEQQNRLMA